MICERCGKNATITLSTDVGRQCAGCFAEWIEPQPVGNVPDQVRHDARAEVSRRPPPRISQTQRERSAAKADVGSFDRDPNAPKRRTGYYDGGIQYIPDDDGYW